MRQRDLVGVGGVGSDGGVRILVCLTTVVAVYISNCCVLCSYDLMKKADVIEYGACVNTCTICGFGINFGNVGIEMLVGGVGARGDISRLVI